MKVINSLAVTLIMVLVFTGCGELPSEDTDGTTMSSVITKGTPQTVNYNSLKNEMFFNGGALADGNINIVLGDTYTQTIVQALETFVASIPSSVSSSLTETPKTVITVTNVDQTVNTYDINTTNNSATIPVDEIKSGKNTFTLEASLPTSFLDTEIPTSFRPSLATIPGITFDVYKGSYIHSGDFTGKTSFDIDVKVGGTTATDVMVAIINYNDTSTTDDDEMIMTLPDASGDISVTDLKSTGGHDIFSENYEYWRVGTGYSDNAGQDLTLTHTVDLREITNTATEITGKFLKIDASSDSAVPFTASDTTAWLHAHYTHDTADYTVQCAADASADLCSGVNTTAKTWVASTVMFPSTASTALNVSYEFTDGTYSIKGLAGHSDYRMIAFWVEKNIDGTNYPIGQVDPGWIGNNDGESHDITLEGRTKTMNGKLNTTDTKIRVARKTQFGGQPFELFSDVVTKDASNDYTITYAYDVSSDTAGTTTYLLWWADASADIDTIPEPCDATADCREITISATTPSTADLTID